MNKKIISLIAVIALVAILGVCLVACNADSYQKKLEKAGYTVVSSTDDSEDASVEWMVVGHRGLLGDTVTIAKFATTDDAKKAESDANSVKVSGTDVYRIGKIVMYGTTQGVKDAK